MNKSYRLIKNRHSGLVQVAPEIAKGRGKSTALKVGAGATAVRGAACLVVVLALLGTAPPAFAADLSWVGGTGTWNTTDNNWNDGTNNRTWDAGSNAIFGGTAGTVTLNANQTVGDITFSSNGYTLTSNAIEFANDVSYMVTNAGHTATINALVGEYGDVSAGALTKLGDGKLILSGSTNYDGDTTISAGILEVRNSLRGNVINNASLIFNRGSGASILFKQIIGNGNLTKTGGGDLSLNGSNTYTGGTTISEGGLWLKNGSALADTGAVTVNGGELNIQGAETIGSLAGTGGTVNLNSHLTVGDASSTSYAGVVQGPSSLSKRGLGTLTLTGNNTYTGVTTIEAGTLEIGNGGTTGSITGDVINNSTLIFNRSDALSYGGVISGTGNFTKQGAGTLTLTGANTYSGTTTVSAGKLVVNGSLTNSAVTVDSGGTLGGSGNASSVTVADGATLAPGQSAGTLSLGPLTLNNSSVLDYELGDPSGTDSDLIAVTGDLTLDGTLNVTDLGSFGAGTYTLITYGGSLTDKTLSPLRKPQNRVYKKNLILIDH